MSTSLQAQDTTVALPRVSSLELADLVQALIAAEPEAAERIRRGVGVLLSGALHPTATCGVYAVDGCEGRVYSTSSASCDCPDATHREHTCKHQYGARLLSAASAVASWNRRQGPKLHDVTLAHQHATLAEAEISQRAISVCRACGREGVALDTHGECDLCAAYDTAPIAYELTAAAEALFAATVA